MKKILGNVTGDFRQKELLSIHQRPWYAYGLLKAAELVKNGYKRFTAIEFGKCLVGVVLKLCMSTKMKFKKLLIYKFYLVGFDTGKGMPHSNDFRDFPDKYHEGDFPC